MISSPMKTAATLLAGLVISAPLAAQRGGNSAGSDSVKAHYRKLEVRIPMRDGVKLFTSVYVPRDTSKAAPILMQRSPYGVAPYGADAYRASLGPSSNPKFASYGFVFVYQDARGRFESEGAFTEMTPHKDVKKSKTDVDESTDTYDTIDWLVKNVPHNNGRVGIYGTSYPGFYTTASCIDPHPALKACEPGAPMTDLWMGDDLFHNGGTNAKGYYLTGTLRVTRGLTLAGRWLSSNEISGEHYGVDLLLVDLMASF